jgi:DNA-binding GntR family transcriptional regulator
MTLHKTNHQSAALETTAFRQGLFDKATLTDRVYETLRADILTNRLPPGTPLQEGALANALGVSRGPIREATRRLAAEGLVSVVPRRGAVVSSLSRGEFINAYQVREALEILAVRLATSRLAPADLEQLEELHQRMVRAAQAEDAGQFFEANAEFHSVFVQRSGNQLLAEIYSPLVDQMRRYRMRSMTLRGGMMRSCEEHQAILEAVRRADVEEAARLVQEHIEIPQRLLASSEGDGELQLAARALLPEEADGESE